MIRIVPDRIRRGRFLTIVINRLWYTVMALSTSEGTTLVRQGTTIRHAWVRHYNIIKPLYM